MAFKKTKSLADVGAPAGVEIGSTETWLRALMRGEDRTGDPTWTELTTTLRVWPGPVELKIPIMEGAKQPPGWIHVRRNGAGQRQSPFAFALGNIARHLDTAASKLAPHLNAALGIDGLFDLQKLAAEFRLGALFDPNSPPERRKVQFLGYVDQQEPMGAYGLSTQDPKLFELYIRAEVDDLRAFLSLCRLDLDPGDS